MSTPDFMETCNELDALRQKKGADYGTGEDPLSNLRSSESFGVPAWENAILRASDKMHRIASFAKKGSLENESVEDSLVDLAVYAIHALRLYRESKIEKDPF